VAAKTSTLAAPGACRATVAGAKKIPTPTIPLMPSASSAQAPTGRASSEGLAMTAKITAL
jgi:hypothetical protein